MEVAKWGACGREGVVRRQAELRGVWGRGWKVLGRCLKVRKWGDRGKEGVVRRQVEVRGVG